MKDYRVSFNDPETMKNHHVRVKAMGIIPAIEAAQAKLFAKGVHFLGWDIWKVEMI